MSETTIDYKKYLRFGRDDSNGADPNPHLMASAFNQSYLNDYKLYYALFNEIPSAFAINGIMLDKAVVFFKKEYGELIIKDFFVELFSPTQKKYIVDEHFYLLNNRHLIAFNDRETCRIITDAPDRAFIEKLTQQIRQFRIREQGHQYKINLITQSRYEGITTEPLKINRIKLNIRANYNDDFWDIHQIIEKRLNHKNDKGLVILHGLPGTGKTSYLRYLTGRVKKKIFFLQPHIAAHITDPEFVSILVSNPNSVLIIEDAENILMNREATGNSVVSILLNLADGLLSDCLNLQIVCTFNTSISNIDDALLRKGRLIAKYEFGKLTLEKTRQLSAQLGFETDLSEPMTLAEVYNQQERSFGPSKEQRKIGF